MLKGSYHNAFEEMPNSGYCHNDIDPYGGAISREGKLLLEHIDELGRAGAGGFLTLHENLEEEKAYLYAFEHTEMPGFLADRLRATLGKHFELIDDGIVDIDGHFSHGDKAPELGALLKKGIVLDLHDGTFEDLMFHAGATSSICSETPGKKDLSARALANCALVRAFLEAVEGRVPVKAIQKVVLSRRRQWPSKP